MILTAHDLTYRHRKGGPPTLDRVSLTLETGARVGLSAPSGRGKTTLCRILAGYERPQEGQILLDGRPLDSVRGPCPVQLIWQHPETAVDPLLPLGETLREGGPPDRRVLDGLHIQEAWLSRYPSELSGGELQRFCVARALGAATRFLLCDEMTAMLDAVNQAALWRFVLAECGARDMGLLVVSHSGALLDRVCTRRVSLEK